LACREVRYIIKYMKQILIEIDDRCARDLERVAPVKTRKRAEFVRLAIRRAIDLALDRETEAAYRVQPLPTSVLEGDLTGWDEQNRLAKVAPRTRARKKAARKAA
jgi:hypothetical protein